MIEVPTGKKNWMVQESTRKQIRWNLTCNNIFFYQHIMNKRRRFCQDRQTRRGDCNIVWLNKRVFSQYAGILSFFLLMSLIADHKIIMCIHVKHDLLLASSKNPAEFTSLRKNWTNIPEQVAGCHLDTWTGVQDIYLVWMCICSWQYSIV